MPRPKKPCPPSPDSITLTPVTLNQDTREHVTTLAGLERKPSQAQAFLQDIEEILNSYQTWIQENKNRPSSASQKLVVADIKKQASRLLQALNPIDPLTKLTYNQAGPFKYLTLAPLWEQHVAAVRQIVETAERAETRLSPHVRPGQPRNTVLRDSLGFLFLTILRHVPSIEEKKLTEIACMAFEGINIKLPDPEDSLRRFRSLLFAPHTKEDQAIAKQAKELTRRINAGEDPVIVLRSMTKPVKS